MLEVEEGGAVAETFEELCLFCERGWRDSIRETMDKKPAAETVWMNQRRNSSKQAPLFIAVLWGHGDVASILLASGANPLLRARSCKLDFCRHGFVTAPDKPCPGYLDPEHPDDPGITGLQMAKNRGLAHVVRLMKHHIINCTSHAECRKYRAAFPEDFRAATGREAPTDDPVLYTVAKLFQSSDPSAPPPPPKWPNKHYGRPFRAAEEGDLTLLRRLQREWDAAAADEEPGAAAGGEVRGEVPRPSPVKAVHPVTGETLLHVAARAPQNRHLVQFLLGAGADGTAQDKFATSPFWWACDHGRYEAAKLLAGPLSIKDPLRSAQRCVGRHVQQHVRRRAQRYVQRHVWRHVC